MNEHPRPPLNHYHRWVTHGLAALWAGDFDSKFTLHIPIVPLLTGTLPGLHFISTDDIQSGMDDEYTRIQSLTLLFDPPGLSATLANNNNNNNNNDAQDFIEFLLQYIRTRNHLQCLSLHAPPLDHMSEEDDSEVSIPPQFLMAAAANPSISSVKIFGGILPASFLLEFLLQNTGVSQLCLSDVCFTGHQRGLRGNLPAAAPLLVLKDLSVAGGLFGTAVDRVFKKIARSLRLARLEVSDGTVGLPRNFPLQTLVKRPSLTHLCLKLYGRIGFFRKALQTAKAYVEDLEVHFPNGSPYVSVAARLRIIAKTLPKMARIKSLFLALPRCGDSQMVTHQAKQALFHTLLQGIDACCSLERIHVYDRDSNNLFTREQIELLRNGRTFRNTLLRRFCVNPTDGREFLKLAPLFPNSPEGRLRVVRAFLQQQVRPRPSACRVAGAVVVEEQQDDDAADDFFGGEALVGEQQHGGGTTRADSNVLVGNLRNAAANDTQPLEEGSPGGNNLIDNYYYDDVMTQQPVGDHDDAIEAMMDGLLFGISDDEAMMRLQNVRTPVDDEEAVRMEEGFL